MVVCLKIVDRYCVATLHVAYMLRTSDLESLEEVFYIHSHKLNLTLLTWSPVI